jgi:hypothetical protein
MKVTHHPATKLLKQIEEQQRQIQALTIDILVLRDLLARTIHMLARLENQGLLPIPEPKKKLKLTK